MSDEFVRLEHLTKKFGPNTVVSDLSLSISKGESLTLLGPSGCGKTTTLRMIAGLDSPDGGAIHIAGVPVVDTEQSLNLPPEKRNIGMVFQSYAIWPHMTVAENVGFPLRVRGHKSAVINKRVDEVLAIVGMAGFRDRPATRLSGGQQQRVAFARALIHEPALLLLDEPFSNLDVKLREQMRLEFQVLRKRLNLTVINVTHDQTEALALSDRIVVLNHGKIEQIGSPRDLYETPRSSFVRDFVGRSATLSGLVQAVNDSAIRVALEGQSAAILECPIPANMPLRAGAAVEISVRPEALQLRRPGEAGEGSVIDCVVHEVLYHGERSECGVRVGDQMLVVYAPAEMRLTQGEAVALAVNPGALKVWPK